MVTQAGFNTTPFQYLRLKSLFVQTSSTKVCGIPAEKYVIPTKKNVYWHLRNFNCTVCYVSRRTPTNCRVACLD